MKSVTFYKPPWASLLEHSSPISLKIVRYVITGGTNERFYYTYGSPT